MNEGPEWRDGFRFAGGHPALDLTATMKGRFKPVPTDRLATPADLGRWLAAAGFESPAPVTADLSAATALREAIYDLAISRTSGVAPNETARDRLNAAACGPAAAAVLRGDGTARIEGEARAVLGHIARHAVILLAGHEKGAIRQCAGDGCAVLFLDQSRAGKRCWCSMGACGNRAKATAFRQRSRVS